MTQQLKDSGISSRPPYNNDYSDAIASGYAAILFKPSFPVQARELTQMGYLLQNQIAGLGSHFFKNGSFVNGTSSFSMCQVVQYSDEVGALNGAIEDFLDQTVIITGVDSNDVAAQFIVKGFATATFGGDEVKLLFVTNTIVGTNQKTSLAAGDTFAVNVTGKPAIAGQVDAVGASSALVVHVDESTFFYDGYLIQTGRHSFVVSSVTPQGLEDFYVERQTCKVGMRVNRTIATINTDSRLGDPARGSNNYGAPGADRLKITLTPYIIPWNGNKASDTPNDNFIELMRLINGQVEGIKSASEYNQLLDLLAQRTYDEFGNFTVDPFLLKFDRTDPAPEVIFNAYTENKLISVNHLDITAPIASPKEYSIPPFTGMVDGSRILLLAQTGVSNAPTGLYEWVDVPSTNGLGYLRTVTPVTNQVAGVYVSNGDGTSTLRYYRFDGSLWNLLDAGVQVKSLLTTADAPTTFTGILDPGVAYHFGYKVQTNTSSKLQIEKARDTKPVENNTMDCRAGSYLICSNLDGLSSINTMQQCLLKNSSNVTIGNAYVFDYFQQDDGKYRVYLHSINITSSSALASQIDKIADVSNVHIADVDVSGKNGSGDTIIFAEPSQAFVFPMAVNPVVAETITGQTYTYRRNDSVNNPASLLGIQMPSVGVDAYYPGSGPGGSAASLGYIILDTDTNTVMTSAATVAPIGSSWSSVLISFSGYDASHTYKIVSPVVKSTGSGVDRKKHLRLNCLVYDVDTAAEFLTLDGNGYVSLNIPDVARIRKIEAVQSDFGYATDVTSLFSFDNGQLDYAYGYASIKLIPNAVAVNFPGMTLAQVINSNQVRVYIDWYEWDGLGGAFTPASYDWTTPNTIPYTNSVGSPTQVQNRYTNLDWNLIATATPSQMVRRGPETEAWFVGYDYQEIPTYQSSVTKNRYDLRQCVDFRPRAKMKHAITVLEVYDASSVASGTTTGLNYLYDLKPLSVQPSATAEFERNPIPQAGAATGETWVANYDVYVSRIDTIALTKDNTFAVVRGVSGLSPKPPAISGDSMALWYVFVPAYTYEPAPQSVIGTYINNQRLTASDIRAYGNRITRLENVVSLTALEARLKDEPILDSTNRAMLKNGIFSDDFNSTMLADTTNLAFQASLDRTSGVLRPSTSMTNSYLVVDTVTSSTGLSLSAYKNYQASATHKVAIFDNRVLTLLPDATEDAFITQPFASETINLNPFSVFRWDGTMTITPRVDNWADTEAQTKIIGQNADYNFGQDFDSWGKTLLGTQADSEGVYSGFDPNTGVDWNTAFNTTDVQTSSSSSGGGLFSRKKVTTTTTVTKSSGANGSTVDATLNTYMRARPVTVQVNSLKPNTVLYVFFDDINVTQRCTPNVQSSTLTSYTDTSTTVVTTTVTDNVIITDANGSASFTFNIPAETFYTGTRTIKVTDTPDGTIGDGTSFATSQYQAVGVTTTKTGFLIPTVTTVSQSSVTKKQSLFGSIIGSLVPSLPSPFSPPSSLPSTVTQSLCWKDPIAQSFLVPADAYPNGVVLSAIGVFFETVDTSIPVTLEIRPSVNGYPSMSETVPEATCVLHPAIDAIGASTTGQVETVFRFAAPVLLPAGEYHIVLRSNSNSYTVWTSVVGGFDVVTGKRITKQPYDGVFFKSANNTTWTADQERDLKMTLYRFTFDDRVNDLPNESGNPYFLNVVPAEDVNMDIMFAKTHAVTHGNSSTNIRWFYRATTLGNTVADSTDTEFVPNQNVFMPSRKVMRNAIGLGSGTPDGRLTVFSRMVTNDRNVTPAIDLQQLSVTAVSNNINSPTPEIELSALPDLVDGAQARYITKPITLGDGFESESLRVDMDINIPSTGSARVDVFYRASGISDPTAFENLPWVQMVLDNGRFSGNSDTHNFTPYTFLPAQDGNGDRPITYTVGTNAPLTGGSSGLIKTFAIKIVMVSSDPANPPRIQSLRGAALL